MPEFTVRVELSDPENADYVINTKDGKRRI